MSRSAATVCTELAVSLRAYGLQSVEITSCQCGRSGPVDGSVRFVRDKSTCHLRRAGNESSAGTRHSRGPTSLRSFSPFCTCCWSQERGVVNVPRGEERSHLVMHVHAEPGTCQIASCLIPLMALCVGVDCLIVFIAGLGTFLPRFSANQTVSKGTCRLCRYPLGYAPFLERVCLGTVVLGFMFKLELYFAAGLADHGQRQPTSSRQVKPEQSPLTTLFKIVCVGIYCRRQIRLFILHESVAYLTSFRRHVKYSSVNAGTGRPSTSSVSFG